MLPGQQPKFLTDQAAKKVSASYYNDICSVMECKDGPDLFGKKASRKYPAIKYYMQNIVKVAESRMLLMNQRISYMNEMPKPKTVLLGWDPGKGIMNSEQSSISRNL